MRRSSGTRCGRRPLSYLDRFGPSDAERKFPPRLFVGPNPAPNRPSDASAPLVTTVDPPPYARLIVSARLFGPPFNPHRLACYPSHPPASTSTKSASSSSSFSIGRKRRAQMVLSSFAHCVHALIYLKIAFGGSLDACSSVLLCASLFMQETRGFFCRQQKED